MTASSEKREDVDGPFVQKEKVSCRPTVGEGTSEKTVGVVLYTWAENQDDEAVV